MDYEKLANRLIDDLLDIFGYADTLNRLVDMGVSEEDLLKLGFDREDAVAELFAREFFLRIQKYEDWKTASKEVRDEIIKRFKYAIQPCMFKIATTSTGIKHLDYTTLRHAQDETSGCGGGSIPEKYWEEQVTVFWEDDLTTYFEEV